MFFLRGGALGLGVATLSSLLGCGHSPRSERNVSADTVAPRAGALRLMSVVAHQDDDLLFINPTIDGVIRDGGDVQTVYVTAGDAGAGKSYWGERENGIVAAYGKMAGSSDVTFETPEFAGQTVYRYTLAGGRVRVVFLRLPDGNGDGSGFASPSDDPNRPQHTSLWKLWSGEIASLPVIGTWSTPGGTSYTRADLVQVLGALMEDVVPTDLATLDSTGASAQGEEFFYGFQHSDHVHSAKFAFEAHLAYADAHRLTMYRDYNISGEAVNLAPSENAEKWTMFATYAEHDMCRPGTPCDGRCTQSCVATYPDWAWRQYPIRQITSGSGWIGGLADRCLAAADPSLSDATAVVIGACADVPQERWTVIGNQIKVAGTTKCLEVPNASTSDGTAVQIAECTGGVSQSWTLSDNGTLRGAGGKCLDVRGASAAEGTPVQIYTCVPMHADGVPNDVLPQQTWALRFGVVAGWSPQFSDAAAGGLFGSASAYYDSFRLADVNGDGRADACARFPDGIYCALNRDGSFDAYARYTTDFSDALGWNAEKYGATIAFADLDADGRADVCGRDAGGLRCATATSEASFSAATRWTSSFSDATGFGAGPALYGSIRLGDVDGDGYADACGRSSAGMVCALNHGGGGFADAVPFLTTDMGDAQGWGAEQYGMTIQLGDVNGDGKADVCGRGGAQVFCALANASGTGFGQLRRWSFRQDFSDAAGWGDARSNYASLRLADVDGDARADLCGRSPTGIVCALSNGLTFGKVLRALPQDFGDVNGWRPDAYGTTLEFGRLGTTRAMGMCGRGGAELLCAHGPGGAGP